MDWRGRKPALPMTSHYRRGSMVGQRVCGGLTIVAMVAVVMVVATAGTAHACSCVERELADYADDISVAFAGSQVERTVHSQVQDNGVALLFSVDRVYKGEVGPFIEVRTHAQDSACGIDMGGRGTVGVVAGEWRGDLNVNLCGSIVTVDSLESVFGDGYPPDEGLMVTSQHDGSAFTQSLLMALIVAGAVLLVFTGAVIWHRRR